MATSMQQGENLAQAFENEKAKLDDVMQDARKSLQKKDIVDAMSSDQITAMALSEIRFNILHQSRFYQSHSWTGNFMTRLPELIDSGDYATIAHKGSKGGVIYGLHPDNPRSAAWLLAWSKSEKPRERNRVYVRAGTRETLLHSGIWREAERALSLATDYSRSHDRESGSVIMAEIRNDNDNDKVALIAMSIDMIN